MLTSPSLLSWASTARKDGGLGSVNIPLYSDKNHKLAKDYGVLIEEEGIALRGLFIIDPRGTIRQVCLLFPRNGWDAHVLKNSTIDYHQ